MGMTDERPVRLRSGWNPSAMLIRGKLTDKQIDRYIKAGYYSSDYRKARKEYWKKKAERRRRFGNFEQAEDGRLVYNPF